MNLALKGHIGPLPCPIAAMARKNKCLGPGCGWNVPGTSTGCLVLETHIQTAKMVEILTLIKDSLTEIDDKMNAAITEAGTLIITKKLEGGDKID